MAQVTAQARHEIDKLLDLLVWQWERLPEVEAEIDGWDLLEQLGFIEEWPLEEMRLRQLEKYVAEGCLNEERLARYERLRSTIQRYRPIISRLQAG
jgi:hypothetical protein